MGREGSKKRTEEKKIEPWERIPEKQENGDER